MITVEKLRLMSVNRVGGFVGGALVYDCRIMYGRMM